MESRAYRRIISCVWKKSSAYMGPYYFSDQPKRIIVHIYRKDKDGLGFSLKKCYLTFVMNKFDNWVSQVSGINSVTFNIRM